MKTTRLGCLSFSGLLTTLVTGLIIGGILWLRGGVIFSPGALNAQAAETMTGGVNSHAEIPRCSACHAPYWSNDDMRQRCLDCHSDLLQNQKSFHAAMLVESLERGDCHQCHTEHHGAAAPLTSTDLATFPHTKVGFSLQGHQRQAGGAAFACSDCHQSGFTALEPAACAACHQQLEVDFMPGHRADFGDDCLACHDGVDTYGKAFDHNKLAFKLPDKHAAVACASCHPGARSQVDLRQTAADCSTCHAKDEPHAGRFGQDCATCHTPAGWLPAAFDHAQSAFPLVGLHATVACQDCHVSGPQGTIFKGRPVECFACHVTDDAHAGQFGQDCGVCHSPEGWEQATFDHSQTAFALTGAHGGVECAQCHPNNVFAGTTQECAACHAEPAFHQGLFSADCTACHTTDRWSPADFNGAHTFPLNHGDGTASCRVCHSSSLLEYTCYGCHEHSQAEVAEKHTDEGIRNFQNCVRCHPSGQKGD